mmetsp:Transcript_56516/g.103767  ORF Transcript_56516/g.103767 Transcript_56516/m.103767 type:complete len:228 (-) Transcript_56516:57-740(-)
MMLACTRLSEDRPKSPRVRLCTKPFEDRPNWSPQASWVRSDQGLPGHDRCSCRRRSPSTRALPSPASPCETSGFCSNQTKSPCCYRCSSRRTSPSRTASVEGRGRVYPSGKIPWSHWAQHSERWLARKPSMCLKPSQTLRSDPLSRQRSSASDRGCMCTDPSLHLILAASEHAWEPSDRSFAHPWSASLALTAAPLHGEVHVRGHQRYLIFTKARLSVHRANVPKDR